MKPAIGLLGVTAACAACCAIPLALPTLLAAAGLGLGVVGLPVAALATGTAAVLLAFMARRKRAKRCSIQTGKPQ
jgi:hypothetical protein